MNDPSTCDRSRADLFLASEQYQPQDEQLWEHLDSCPDCHDYIEQQAADPGIWKQTIEMLQPSEFDEAGSNDFSAATIAGNRVMQPVAAQDVLDALAPTDDPHRLGRLGTYEVTGVVGVGGMGVVLKAVDPSLDRVVAVKVMAPQLANNEKARQRFAREAKAAAAVLHPNVIPIHSVASSDSLPYLVMSYVRGGSLQRRLENEGPLPVVEVLRIGSQIAAGLAAAHDQGLVHRDIKPENILLEEGVERVTITDFGLARAVDDNTVTQQGTIAGTPQYMSPEQARGDNVDQSSDLFSLGSVLYALCTGRPPYRGDTSFGVMRQIIDESPTPVQDLKSDVPNWLAAIVAKLMSKTKADRFATAMEVHELLETCLSHIQQPDEIPLPQIPGSRLEERKRPFLKTTKGLLTMTALPAAVMALIVAFQLLGFFKPPTNDVNAIPAAITKSADLPVTEINTDLAERLIGRREHLTFSKLRSLSPDAATILAKHPANLEFPALKQISPAVAKALARKDQLWLSLGGLEDLSPEVAQEFASVKCAMRLSGVRTISLEAATNLVKSDASLSLGLTKITPDVAKVLSQHGGWLSLNSLQTIDPDSAVALATNKHWLSLNGLNELTPAVAAALGCFDGDMLDLNGLQVLDVETAKRLAKARCKSGLYMNNLTTDVVTHDVIKALCGGNSVPSLQGLKNPDELTQLTLRLRFGLSLREGSHQAKEVAGEVAALRDQLIKSTNPHTENWRRAHRDIAHQVSSFLSKPIQQPMAESIADLTEPYSDIRTDDRLAAAGRPTESLGWDIQATHALALARAGKFDEALKENELLRSKIDINVNGSQVPNVSVGFFGKQRSNKSLLQQMMLQESLILARAGQTADAVDASTAAGKIEVGKPTENDSAAIQKVLRMIAATSDQVSGDK